jgi:glyoxylase-like metal-dependent hydrolase (beta-lactamase superfamily II)
VYGYQEGPQFLPGITVADGEAIGVGSIELLAVHTPGHTPDHLCFRVDDVLFTGDHIMGGSTVIIEDAAQYLDSLYLVRDLHVARLEPGHGNAMDDAAAAINDYIDHRLERERQIITAIAGGASSIGDIVDVVYVGIPSGLRDAALHQVGVQISKLFDDGVVWYEDRRLGDHTTIRLS